MTNEARRARVSFQTKVLVPVLAVLVLVPAATVLVVDRHLDQEMQDQAQQTLATAKVVFRRSLENQSRDLISRFRNLVNEVSFYQLGELANRPTGEEEAAARSTIERFVKERLTEYGPDYEVMTFTSVRDGKTFGGVRADAFALEAFAKAAAPVTTRVLRGDAAGGVIGLGGHYYQVIAVPVYLRQQTGVDEEVAALTVGMRITEATLQDLKTLPHTEAVFVADGAVAVTTARDLDAVTALVPSAWPSRDSGTPWRVGMDGEHFLAVAGTYETMAQGVRYLLLSSYEPQLRALEATRRTLLEVSLGGILLGALVVGFFMRRITQPLRELRDMAEAVGRGDFSRKIERFSNDECGELAEEFNRMTANLQGSRTELERTVETLKNTQAQLVQSEKLSAVGQFVAGVAHELNNPLTSVIGFAELLSSMEANEKNRRHLDLIAKSAHRCHKIVQNLLSFARQHAPERKLVAVNTLVDDVLEIMAYDLRTSNVTVKREFTDGLPKLMADPHQVQQVFVNILGNARQAIQAFRRDGEIAVRTRAADGMVRIEFQDNGPGIRAENLSRIFDPFFTTKPVGKGTGLGLSLSYGIIQEHGGKISAHSEVGHGALFVIELPAATSPVAAVLRPEATVVFPRPSRPTAAGAGRSVLVIDDEAWILELTEELLRNEGYDVEAVSAGELALARIRERNFDVIVSDWKMPGLSGIYLYEQLLATDPTAAARILFMTGDVINDTFEQFLERHGRTCLSKPFAIDDFRAAVAAMTAGTN
ncbi:MAG TPA: ATP-binding protein [Opitutus sp.]|nr:ATP-binding protein [Opitutus sp.]